jgi:hypothetical protein
LIFLPWTKYARRTRPIVSTVIIPVSPRSRITCRSASDRGVKGSVLDANHPSNGVNIPRRGTSSGRTIHSGAQIAGATDDAPSELSRPVGRTKQQHAAVQGSNGAVEGAHKLLPAGGSKMEGIEARTRSHWHLCL